MRGKDVAAHARSRAIAWAYTLSRTFVGRIVKDISKANPNGKPLDSNSQNAQKTESTDLRRIGRKVKFRLEKKDGIFYPEPFRTYAKNAKKRNLRETFALKNSNGVKNRETLEFKNNFF